MLSAWYCCSQESVQQCPRVMLLQAGQRNCSLQALKYYRLSDSAVSKVGSKKLQVVSKGTTETVCVCAVGGSGSLACGCSDWQFGEPD